MKLSHHLFAAALVLAAPSVVRADTVYFARPDRQGIASVSGTIVRETDGSVVVDTGDGHTVSIPRSEVYEIVRDTPSGGSATAADPSGTAGDPWNTARRPIFGRDGHYGPRPYHWGVKGGMNISNLAVDPQELEDGGSLKSFALGAWWGVPLDRRFTFQAEALYSVRGDAESDGGSSVSTRVAYLEVPAIARIGFLHDGPARPCLFAGPSLAVNLSAKSTLESEGGSNEVDVKDQVRPLDLGLLVGGGLDFSVGGRTCGVELRYSRGLTNAVGDAANGDAHNSVLAMMGSVRLQ